MEVSLVVIVVAARIDIGGRDGVLLVEFPVHAGRQSLLVKGETISEVVAHFEGSKGVNVAMAYVPFHTEAAAQILLCLGFLVVIVVLIERIPAPRPIVFAVYLLTVIVLGDDAAILVAINILCVLDGSLIAFA